MDKEKQVAAVGLHHSIDEAETKQSQMEAAKGSAAEEAAAQEAAAKKAARKKAAAAIRAKAKKAADDAGAQDEEPEEDPVIDSFLDTGIINKMAAVEEALLYREDLEARNAAVEEARAYRQGLEAKDAAVEEAMNFRRELAEQVAGPLYLSATCSASSRRRFIAYPSLSSPNGSERYNGTSHRTLSG